MKHEIEIIWTDLSGELLTYIKTKIKDEDLSKDILQDVFLKVYTKIDTLKEPSKLTSWVYQITRNTIADYFRKQKVSTALDALDLPDTAAEDADYSKLTSCINKKIEGLSGKYKEAIILTTFKNISQKDLAKYLNISYSGAKSQVQRARIKLKDDILNCPNVETDKEGNIIDFKD